MVPHPDVTGPIFQHLLALLLPLYNSRSFRCFSTPCYFHSYNCCFRLEQVKNSVLTHALAPSRPISILLLPHALNGAASFGGGSEDLNVPTGQQANRLAECSLWGNWSRSPQKLPQAWLSAFFSHQPAALDPWYPPTLLLIPFSRHTTSRICKRLDHVEVEPARGIIISLVSLFDHSHFSHCSFSRPLFSSPLTSFLSFLS